MKAKQNGDEFIIQDTPGILWILGLFFAFIGGIFIYAALGGVGGDENTAPHVTILALLMGGIAVTIGIWQIQQAFAARIVINRQTEKVTITKSRLFGKNIETYDLDQIRGFRTIEDKSEDGVPIWQFGLEFTSGKCIELSALPVSAEEQRRELAYTANRFIGKNLPGYHWIDEAANEKHGEIG